MATTLLALLVAAIMVAGSAGLILPNTFYHGTRSFSSDEPTGGAANFPPRLSPSLVCLASKRRREYTEEEQRLLLTEPAVAAYVRAEVSAWLVENSLAENPTMTENDAVDDIARAAEQGYLLASQQGILSNHGALISFLQTELRNKNNFRTNRHQAFTLAKTTPYQVAKRCTDVLHHRLYRGTYTKTMAPTGAGELAALEAVGLSTADPAETREQEDDNCLVEPPAELKNSVDCLWTERDQAEWRSRRFEKITMEGWRDPRRGNSGTSR